MTTTGENKYRIIHVENDIIYFWNNVEWVKGIGRATLYTGDIPTSVFNLVQQRFLDAEIYRELDNGELVKLKDFGYTGMVGDGLTRPDGIVRPEKADKPPLGLRPRPISDTHRAIEILDAMRRFVDVCRPIPQSWADELMEIRGENNERT